MKQAESKSTMTEQQKSPNMSKLLHNSYKDALSTSHVIHVSLQGNVFVDLPMKHTTVVEEMSATGFYTAMPKQHCPVDIEDMESSHKHWTVVMSKKKSCTTCKCKTSTMSSDIVDLTLDSIVVKDNSGLRPSTTVPHASAIERLQEEVSC